MKLATSSMIKEIDEYSKTELGIPIKEKRGAKKEDRWLAIPLALKSSIAIITVTKKGNTLHVKLIAFLLPSIKPLYASCFFIIDSKSTVKNIIGII